MFQVTQRIARRWLRAFQLDLKTILKLYGYPDPITVRDVTLGQKLKGIANLQQQLREGLKSRYRDLTMQWHPDRNPDPGATQKLQWINLARPILGQWASLSPEEALAAWSRVPLSSHKPDPKPTPKPPPPSQPRTPPPPPPPEDVGQLKVLAAGRMISQDLLIKIRPFFDSFNQMEEIQFFMDSFKEALKYPRRIERELVSLSKENASIIRGRKNLPAKLISAMKDFGKTSLSKLLKAGVPRPIAQYSILSSTGSILANWD